MSEYKEKRRALLALMTDYLEAVLAKDPSGLPIAPDANVRYNGEPCVPGDNAMWRKTLRFAGRQTFVDTETGNAFSFVVCTNEVVPLPEQYWPDEDHLYVYWASASIRLKVEDGLITEIEEVVLDQRMNGFPNDFSTIQLPDLQLEMPVPEEERYTREELIAVVEAYWDSIERSVDPFTALPTHPASYRLENGSRTVEALTMSGSMLSEFHSEGFRWETPKSERRYPIVDPSRGLVVSYSLFKEAETGPTVSQHGSLIVEAFRVEDGLMRYLYAHFRPDMQKTGFERR